MLPPVTAELGLVSASRGARAVPSGRRSRAGIVSPRRSSPSRGVATTTTPNQRPRISQPSTRTSTPVSSSRRSLPQVILMHDASHGSQVRPHSGEPPRGDQDLGRGQDAHHDSMGTCGVRRPPRPPGRRPPGWGRPPDSGTFGGRYDLSRAVAVGSMRLLTGSAPENVMYRPYCSGHGQTRPVGTTSPSGSPRMTASPRTRQPSWPPLTRPASSRNASVVSAHTAEEIILRSLRGCAGSALGDRRCPGRRRRRTKGWESGSVTQPVSGRCPRSCGGQ